MKVSFDFDGTLRRLDVQRYAKSLVDAGHEVWIVTTRTSTEDILARGWHWSKDQNIILFEVAETCGILREHIVFTDHQDKIHFLKGKGFTFHLDDDSDELLYIIESGDPCKPVNVGHFEWKEDCNNLLH
jgi:sulfur transfer complex TusBCD TusB component (DsrH family)